MKLRIALALAMAAGAQAAVDPWQIALENSRQSQLAIQFCHRYANGWLQFADTTSGLLPRRVDQADLRYWNARDCAADNYPFLTLVGEMTDNYSIKLMAGHILQQERKLTSRVDSLPDDFDFATQAFKTAEPRMPDLIFGAAEYAKDGLIPITEWMGPSAWSKRAEELIRDIWKHAQVDSPLGKMPTDVIEVDGDLLQAMSRMYWMTGDERYKEWTFKIADLYLFHKRLLDNKTLHLRDHGCEIIGGLAEAYVIAAYKDPVRHEKYKPELYAILDFISRRCLTEDGMMYIRVDTQTGQPTVKGISDGFGYVYDAFLTVAAVDNEQRFVEPVIHTLSNINRVELEKMEGIVGGAFADQIADSLEGTINLLNRIPISSAFDWVDRKMAHLFGLQRADGIIEAWYGDGNSARTALMYALYKTQGVTPSPWRDDVQIGASRDYDGVIRLYIKSEYPWSGRLRFDRPRHREYLHLPLDYARINQFPEWFTVESNRQYSMVVNDEPAKLVNGKDLLSWPLSLTPGQPVLLTIRQTKTHADASANAKRASEAVALPATATKTTSPPPPVTTKVAPPVASPTPTAAPLEQVATPPPPPSPKEAPLPPATSTAPAGLRAMRYSPRGRQDAIAWQEQVRSQLFDAMKMPDLLKADIPLSPRLLSTEWTQGYLIREVEFNSTSARRIKAIVTVPTPATTTANPSDVQIGTLHRQTVMHPAIVCIHGHGGNRRIVYDDKSIYKGFAAHLAANGYVTISTEVGQHKVYESERTLMGERLWDLMRCVDLLTGIPEVNKDRIGCAGLSLGGEMAMWLGAMDTRIQATASCGFLTVMDQMEHNHCMCWKFDGLRELVDFADIYSLTAPRALQCQNGLAEPPDQFPVSLAGQAINEIKHIYANLGAPNNAELATHPGGHVVDVEAMSAFLKKHLAEKK